VGLLFAATTVLGTASASATTVTKTIPYNCTFPIFGDRTTNIQLRATLPATVHDVFPAMPASATLALPGDLVSLFPAAGATQVNGTGNVPIDLHVGSTTVHLPVTGTVASTPVPPSGPMTITLSESTSPVPVSTGTITVSAGTSLVLHLTPRTSTGASTSIGTLDITCATTGNTMLGTVISTP
jgi:hypothetical protein